MLPKPMFRTRATEDLDGADPDSVRAAYARLTTQPADLPLLRAWAEVRCVVDEAGSHLHLAVHRDRHDALAQQGYQRWRSRTLPEAQQGDQELAERFVEVPEEHEARVARIRRQRRAPPDPALLEREQALMQRYLDVREECWPVEVDGSRLEVAEFMAVMADPDRSLRERAWRARLEGQLRVADRVDELFSELVAVRHALAQGAGDPSYREYRYRELDRDWNAADAAGLRASIEASVVPALRELDARAAASLGIDAFAPWDHDAAPGLAAPDYEALAREAGARMHALDPELGALFDALWPRVDYGCSNDRLAADFHDFFRISRHSVLFLTPVGRAYDQITLVHELGHAMHAARSAVRHPWACLEPALEVCELAAHGHEALHLSRLPPALRQQYLHNLLRTVTVCALLDEMQDWVATHPGHSVSERRAMWDELSGRFCPDQPLEWTHGPRIGAAIPYLRPFYALEYSYANLGALSFGRRHADQPEDAIASYKALLDAGPAGGSASLYAVAGLPLVPSSDQLTDAMRWALDAQ